MDLSYYRELLDSSASQAAALGADRPSAIFLRWARQLEALTGTPQFRASLQKHASEVLRSTKALVILSLENSDHAIGIDTDASRNFKTTSTSLLSEAQIVVDELKRTRAVVGDKGIAEIAGQMLTAVQFVMDYVELHFENCGLAAFTSPEVRQSDIVYRLGDADYRDALCRLIGVQVRSATDSSEEIVIESANGVAITISLRAEDRVGPESALFNSPSGGLWVWNG